MRFAGTAAPGRTGLALRGWLVGEVRAFTGLLGALPLRAPGFGADRAPCGVVGRFVGPDWSFGTCEGTSFSDDIVGSSIRSASFHRNDLDEWGIDVAQ